MVLNGLEALDIGIAEFSKKARFPDTDFISASPIRCRNRNAKRQGTRSIGIFSGNGHHIPNLPANAEIHLIDFSRFNPHKYYLRPLDASSATVKYPHWHRLADVIPRETASHVAGVPASKKDESLLWLLNQVAEESVRFRVSDHHQRERE